METVDYGALYLDLDAEAKLLARKPAADVNNYLETGVIILARSRGYRPNPATDLNHTTLKTTAITIQNKPTFKTINTLYIIQLNTKNFHLIKNK